MQARGARANADADYPERYFSTSSRESCGWGGPRRESRPLCTEGVGSFGA